MARIRSLKPELPQDAKLAKVSRNTRYTFLLLLTQVDDEGYFRATPRTLLGLLYPHDPDVTERTLCEELDSLLALGVIRCFDTPDGPLGQLANFAKHQKIDHPAKSHLATLSRTPRETFAPRVLSLESLVLSPDHSAAAPSAPVSPQAATAGRVKRKAKTAKTFPEDPTWEQTRAAYPRRLGGHNWTIARERRDGIVATGQATADQLLVGVRAYAADMRQAEKIGTDKVLMAASYFGEQERWRDYLPHAAPVAPRPASPGLPEPTPEETMRELDAKAAKMRGAGLLPQQDVAA